MRRMFRDTPSLLARIAVVRLFNLSPSPPELPHQRSTHLPCDSRSYDGLKGRFSATVGEEPEVEVTLDLR